MLKTLKKFFNAKYNLGRAVPPRTLPSKPVDNNWALKKLEKKIENKDVITISDLKEIFSEKNNE